MVGVFPQYLGDRFGWPEMAATLSRAYHQLPAAEQAQTCIFTVNYGEAAALNFYAKKYEPPARHQWSQQLLSVGAGKLLRAR